LANGIFQNDGNPFQNLQKSFLFFIFRGNLEKIHPIAPRAGSGRLGPAQAGSAQLGPAQAGSAQLVFFFENPVPSEDLKKMISGRCPRSDFFIVGVDGFEVADCGYLCFFFRSQFSSTG